MVANEWEETYASGRHINSWPWSDLVSLYFRYLEYLGLRELGPKVLELGPGPGNNFPFWRALSADYFGIEMSPSAIDICIKRYPELAGRLQNGDFSLLESNSRDFDVICDRASVTHCSSIEVQNVITMSFNSLKQGGLYMGIDWFSKNHSDFNLPGTVVDSNTKSGFTSGQFVGLGQVHFVDRAEMLHIFKEFEVLELTEKIVTSHYPNSDSRQFAAWNIVARKPS